MANSPQSSKQLPRTYGSLSRRHVLVAMSGLVLGLLLPAMDQTIVATALPTIAGDLHDLTHMSWIVTAYMLAMAVAMPIFGKIGDLHGRKPVYMVSIVIFLAGSALCGLSGDMTQMIVFRTLQGVGGGGLLVTAQATIADLVPPRERGRYQGYTATVTGLAPIIGPLFGGILTDHLSWRWVFYINLPLGLLALVVGALVLDLPRGAGRSRIDTLGATLIGAALTCFILVTSWGGSEYTWDSPVIVILAAVGVVMLGAFALVERSVGEPLIPLHLFRKSTFNITATISFLVGFVRYGGVTFVPLFLQIVSGVSATNSGVLLLPMMLGVIFASRISGHVTTRTGRYKWSPIAGTAVVGIAFFLLSTMNGGTPPFISGTYMVLLGVGIGLTMPVVVVAAQNAAPAGDVGVTTSTVALSLQLGGAFGASVFGAIFAVRLTAQLAEYLPASALNQVPHTTSITPDLIESLPQAVRHGFQLAFTHAIEDVFSYGLPFIAVTLLLAFMMREIPLRGAKSEQH